MKGSYVGKPSRGKLLRMDMEWEDGLVVQISIRGDFFAHPENAFDEAEAALAGARVAELGDVFERELSARGVTLFGLTPVDVGAAAATIVVGAHNPDNGA
ncbi:MAG: hypothetical protein JXM71_06745 [Spirochaetales bacterium]|nr:hypothetical protein [Spirochaetales bacterium]